MVAIPSLFGGEKQAMSHRKCLDRECTAERGKEPNKLKPGGWWGEKVLTIFEPTSVDTSSIAFTERCRLAFR